MSKRLSKMPQIRLSESNREALIIRWRRLLTSGLTDFFSGANDFGKLSVKELFDMYEGLIKAFAEGIGISLFTSGGKWKTFRAVLEEVCAHQSLPTGLRDDLQEINSTVNTQEYNSLKKLRNDETHYLNLPDIPKETVRRVWRLFYRVAGLVDIELFEYAKGRPELEDFYFLQDFFRKVVLEGNKEHIDLNRIKKGREIYPYIKVDKNIKTVEVEVEKGILEVIRSVMKGEYM